MRTLRPRLWRSTRPRKTQLGALADAPRSTIVAAPAPEPPQPSVERQPPPAQPPRLVQADDSLAVEEFRQGARHRLALAGELALASLASFESLCARLWAQPVTAVTLDLSELTFIDSSGLWAVTRLHKRCLQEHVEFRVIPGPESIQEVFELTGLSDVIPFAVAQPAPCEGA